MPGLFDIIDSARTAETYRDWRPPTPPSLASVDELELDFETKNLDWWNDAEAIGVAYYLPDGTCGYLPWGHRGNSQAQLPKETVVNWLQKEVRGKRITNAHIKTEVHFARKLGVDLEAQGNRVSDVQHYAALLDDSRKRFAQEVLCKDYAIDDDKVTIVDGIEIDASRMWEYHPGMVAVRAIGDVRQVHKLKKVMWPLLEEQGLHRVRELEDRVIFPTCEMEWNGAKLNVEKLFRWRDEITKKYEDCIWQIFKQTGLRFNPDSGADWAKLFAHLKLPIENFTATGKGSFTANVLKRVNHPLVQLGLQAARYADKLSKYINKYCKTVNQQTGIIRYQLHQLASDEGGTVSGRYSSSSFKLNNEEVGINIQQVLAVEKDYTDYGGDYIIRELFEAETGDHLSADAAQIEYRIFADKANNPKVIAAYKENPRLKFHHKIQEFLKPYKPNLGYKPVKNLNFMKIYGGKTVKLAFMIGDITESEMASINRKPWRERMQDPRLAQAIEIEQIYNRELPEVDPLLALASHLAANCCIDSCQNGELATTAGGRQYRKGIDALHRNKVPHRGYVMTETGRRMRFPKNWRLHKALNGVIQGTAADVNKTKICELHENRKYTGLLMRHTEHDEICGDARQPETAGRVDELLNQQSFPHMKVPILWDVDTGANWKECSDYWKELQKREGAGVA